MNQSAAALDDAARMGAELAVEISALLREVSYSEIRQASPASAPFGSGATTIGGGSTA